MVVESLAYGGTNQAVLFTPRTPVIKWPKPADITYATALGPTAALLAIEQMGRARLK